MRTIQEWLGHADFMTTLVYADYQPSEHERAWVERAFAGDSVVPQGVPQTRSSDSSTSDEKLL
jgi:hypothetical protein